MRNQRWLLPVFAFALTAIALRVLDRTADRLYPPPLDLVDDISTEVVDHEGELLRPFVNSHDRWRLALDIADLDPRYVELLLAYEDRRFRRHFGVDPLALVRAAGQLLLHGEVVSGGSTITMQLARLLEPRPRTMSAKLHQMWRAVQIERRLSKRHILEAYLTLAPYGGNVEGIRAAALAYFGRGVGHLPPAEAALLIALPQSPEARRPDRHPTAAQSARNRVLDRVVAMGVMSSADAKAAMRGTVDARRQELPALAAHLSERLAFSPGAGRRISTHIDASLQGRLERLAQDHARMLGPKSSFAILVAEHATGQIVAHVGSPDPMDLGRSGPIDMTEAVRSPGSALKPFIYGLAFEAGIAHPETLIDDRPTDFSGYAPRNFDNEFRGTVTMREALSWSLNIPAVRVLEEVGPTRLLARLRRAGARPELPGGGSPGLAVALGGVGITLTDLVSAYGAIARGGESLRLHATGDGTQSLDPQLVLDRNASWYVTDILTKTPPPEAALGGRIAYKTGTSYGYRDAWAIGFDGRHVIGVWAGRPDGTPVSGLSGHSTAAPVLFAAFARLENGLKRLGAPPPDIIAGTGANLPEPMRRFGRATVHDNLLRSAQPLSIAFPPQGAHLEFGGTEIHLSLKAAGGSLPLTWFVNGKPVATNTHRRDTFWQPDGRGYSDLAVIDAEGRAARSRVFLE